MSSERREKPQIVLVHLSVRVVNVECRVLSDE